MISRPTPAERLLAILDDPDTVESLDVAEVRADLAALGIDTGPATAFAKGLAASKGSPAARLLGAIDDAEDADEQIARLEGADIEDIRRLTPQGTAAAVAADARRKAGGESNVVGIRPRHPLRGILRWGGAFGGIAASLLVVMFIGRSYLAGQRAQIESQSARSVYSAPAPAMRDEHVPGAPIPAEPEADVLAKGEESGEERKLAEGSAPAASTAPAPMGDFGPERFAGESAAASKPAEGLLGRSDEAAVPARRSRVAPDASITAMLLADPAQAPAQIQSQHLPTGTLSDRLEEARRLAGDRPVIALFTVAEKAGTRDYVQVPLMPKMTQQQAAPLPLIRLLGADAANYDFIPLPSP